MEHVDIPAGERHAPHQWVVADEAARLALVPAAGDLGAYCWQQSDNTEWMLTGHAPAVWAERGRNGSDATVTVPAIESALGYTPASTEDVADVLAAAELAQSTADAAGAAATSAQGTAVAAGEAADLAQAAADAAGVAVDDLEARQADTSNAAVGAGMEGFADGLTYPLDRVGGQINIIKSRDTQLIGQIPRSEWAAIANGTSSYDVGPTINALLAAAPGRAIILPAGLVRLGTAVSYISTGADIFNEAPKIHGPGSDICVVDTRVANAAAFTFDTDAVAVARFLRNLEMCGFSLTGEYGSPVNASGLSLRHVFNGLIDDVFIRELALDGIYVALSEGDTDGSNNIIVNRSRVYQCGRWGFNNNSTGGYNEFSFLTITGGTSISACGTASAWDPSTGAQPTSGGLRWKGNGAKLTDMYFTECNGPAVYIEGGAGLAVQFAMRDATIENCGRSATAAAFYSSGVGGLDLQNVDLRNNDFNVARYGFFLEASTYATLGVVIDSIKAQVTSGNNPHTMFEARGSNGVDLSIRNTAWRNYGHAGQTRFGTGVASTFQSSFSIEDSARSRYIADRTIETTYTSANPVHTIDFVAAKNHVVILSTTMTGTLDFSAPNYGSTSAVARVGREIVITIFNNTAAAKSITFSGISTRTPPTTLAAGAVTVGRFVYVASIGFSQNGPWG